MIIRTPKRKYSNGKSMEVLAYNFNCRATQVGIGADQKQESKYQEKICPPPPAFPTGSWMDHKEEPWKNILVNSNKTNTLEMQKENKKKTELQRPKKDKIERHLPVK